MKKKERRRRRRRRRKKKKFVVFVVFFLNPLFPLFPTVPTVPAVSVLEGLLHRTHFHAPNMLYPAVSHCIGGLYIFRWPLCPQKPLQSLPSSSPSSMLLPDLIVLDTPETPATFASSTPLAARRRTIEDEHWSPSPLPRRKSPSTVVAAILPKVQQPQLQPEFSPASEAKLEGFKRALRNKEHVWCSWIDKESGHVKSKGQSGSCWLQLV